MNPGSAVVMTAVIVTVGQWSADKPVTARIVVGGAVLGLGLTAMGESAPDLAGKFGALVLVAALFTYGPAIAWKFGLIDHAKYPAPPKWIV